MVVVVALIRDPLTSTQVELLQKIHRMLCPRATVPNHVQCYCDHKGNCYEFHRMLCPRATVPNHVHGPVRFILGQRNTWGTRPPHPPTLSSYPLCSRVARGSLKILVSGSPKSRSRNTTRAPKAPNRFGSKNGCLGACKSHQMRRKTHDAAQGPTLLDSSS